MLCVIANIHLVELPKRRFSHHGHLDMFHGGSRVVRRMEGGSSRGPPGREKGEHTSQSPLTTHYLLAAVPAIATPHFRYQPCADDATHAICHLPLPFAAAVCYSAYSATSLVLTTRCLPLPIANCRSHLPFPKLLPLPFPIAVPNCRSLAIPNCRSLAIPNCRSLAIPICHYGLLFAISCIAIMPVRRPPNASVI
jgi:hypothetical protein